MECFHPLVVASVTKTGEDKNGRILSLWRNTTKIRLALWYVSNCKSFVRLGIWEGAFMISRPGDLGKRGSNQPVLKMEVMWVVGAATEPPLSLGVRLTTSLYRPWMVTSRWRWMTSGQRSRICLVRTGRCFCCHSMLSTSFLPLPGPSWKNSFTPDSQKGISFRETWRWWDWHCLFSCCLRLYFAVTSPSL